MAMGNAMCFLAFRVIFLLCYLYSLSVISAISRIIAAMPNIQIQGLIKSVSVLN